MCSTVFVDGQRETSDSTPGNTILPPYPLPAVGAAKQQGVYVVCVCVCKRERVGSE